MSVATTQALRTPLQGEELTRNNRSKQRPITTTGAFFSRPELLLFGLIFALRLVSAWKLHQTPYGAPLVGDMKFYSDWATRIADGHLFDSHAFYGEPLYAFVLGGIFRVFGFQPILVSLLQGTLDAFTGVLIYRIALLAFAKASNRAAWIGVIAAIGWGFFVPAAAYSGLLISVSWVVTTWWFCIWWLLRRRACASLVEWFTIALLTGVIAMMSATVLCLVPLLVGGAFSCRSARKTLIMIILGLLVGTSPCWIYNTLVARDPVFLSAHGGINLWIGNNPEADGYPRIPQGLPSEQEALLRQSVVIAELETGHSLPYSGVSRFWSDKSQNYIATHFTSWLGLLLTKVWNFWNGFQYDDLSSITALRDAGIVVPGLYFGLIAALGLPGLLLATRIPAARWIIAAVLAQMLALLPVFINERYRLPAVPGLLLLSAFFLSELARAVASKNIRDVTLGLAMLAMSSWFVAIPPTDQALRTLDDYKTAMRQIGAGQYSAAKGHLQRALATMVAPSQVAPAMARTFMEAAAERLKSGDVESAQAATLQALLLQPNDESLGAFQQLLDQKSLAR